MYTNSLKAVLFAALFSIALLLPNIRPCSAETWLWKADNHKLETIKTIERGMEVERQVPVSYFEDGRNTFTMFAEGGAMWVWDEPAPGLVSYRSLMAWMGEGRVARGFARSSDFGDALDIRKGITVAARVKPIYSHSHGTLMLSVANESSSGLPDGSTHVWVGWTMPDEIRFYSRNGTCLKHFASSVKYDGKWSIWTLGAKQIGDTVAWDLWIDGVHQGADQKAADGSLHTLLYSKDTDRGTSVCIGQRMPMLAPHDAVWDYVAISNEGVIPGWDGGAEASEDPLEENLPEERQNELVKLAVFRVHSLTKQEPYGDLERYAEILEICEDALRRFKDADPEFLEHVKSYRLASLLRLGRTDEAVAAIRVMKAESASASHRAILMLSIADTYLNAKRYSEAAEAYQSALTMELTEYGQDRAGYGLAVCHWELGYKDLARNYLEGLIERSPESEWAKRARGQLYVWDVLLPAQNVN